MSETQSVAVRSKQVRDIIESKWGDIQKALPQHVTPTRFLRVIQNALGKNPKLLDCTPTSLIAAITVSSELGLEINTPLGLAYVIPYQQSKKDAGGRWVKTMEAQFQIGYKGIIDLAYRSGRVRSIAAEVVYANDEFRRTLGLHRDLIHVPATSDRGEAIGYYATVYVDGVDPIFDFMTAEEAHEHGKRFSKAYQYDLKENKQTSPWSTNFDAMALKTVVLKALKFAPKAIEDPALRTAMDHEDRDFAIDTTAAPLVPAGPEVGEYDPDAMEATPVQPEGFQKAQAETSPQPKGEDTEHAEIERLEAVEAIGHLAERKGMTQKKLDAIIHEVGGPGTTIHDLDMSQLRAVADKMEGR
jgi:recombination protein RecT